MTRSAIEACLPWLLLLILCAAILRLIVAFSQARPNWKKLLALHRDQAGSVQSLSFVLTLPVFIMIMMLIVQVSQLMVATIVVHYAAYAAARSAVVWIPASLGPGSGEGFNRVSSISPDPLAPIDGNGVTYAIDPGSAKFRQIEKAAVLACLPISPSRDTGTQVDGQSQDLLAAVQDAYRELVPSSVENTRIPTRLQNKLAYSLANTRIDVAFLHKDEEPPIDNYDLGHNIVEFNPNEVGWQDPIRVSVSYDLALLPGPGRLLARRLISSRGEDTVAASIDQRGRFFVRTLTASITLAGEGEKPVLPYIQRLEGFGPPPSGGGCEAR